MKKCQAFADNGNEVILLVPDLNEKFEIDITGVFEFYDVKNNFEIRKLLCPNSKGGSFLYSLANFLY